MPMVSNANDPGDYGHIFELAPVSLWLEDYSELQVLFEGWRREGVQDLRAHLAEDPGRVAECTRCMRVLRVNQRTLTLFGARNQRQMMESLDRIFSGEMLHCVVPELIALWDGALAFENQSVNYTLGGQRLDILVRGRVLPGHEHDWSRVLISLEDITERMQRERERNEALQLAHDLFERSPASLWVEDYSEVRARLDELRGRGVENLAAFLREDPGFVHACMQAIRIVDVNQTTVDWFGAAHKDELLARVGDIFRDDMADSFAAELLDLWDGVYTHERTVVNHTLDGRALSLHMRLTVLEENRDRWDRVLVSLERMPTSPAA